VISTGHLYRETDNAPPQPPRALPTAASTMDPAAPADPLAPHYIVRLSDALAALLGTAGGAQINEGGVELSEDELVDGLRAAGLIITYPSTPTAQHPTLADHAATSTSHPAAAAATSAEGAPARRVVRLAGAIAALLVHAEGAEVSEDEARGSCIQLLRTSSPPTSNILPPLNSDASACTRSRQSFALAPWLSVSSCPVCMSITHDVVCVWL